MKGIIIMIILALLGIFSGCAGGPGKPGEAPTTQPSTTPNMDYMYRSPPPAMVRP